MDTKHKKIIGIILIVLGSLVLALIIFKAGMMVGFNKAMFTDRFGENYYRTFERFGKTTPRAGMVKNFFSNDKLPGGHGVVGKIIKINLPNIVVESPDNIEKVILTNESTLVREFRDSITLQDISLGDTIVVLGTPDDKGQVVATLVRIVPHFPMPGLSTSSRPIR